MKHPTKQQVQTVIDNFEKVLPMALKMESSVNMMAETVDHSCETPMCHAGWYAAACKIQSEDYDSGAQKMANDLGFESAEKLKLWAQQNPKIWGTKYGDSMFCSSSAFSSFGCASIKGFVFHWKGVQSRLPETNK